MEKYRRLLEAKRLELKPLVEGLDEPLPPHDVGDVANGCVTKEMMAVFQDIRTQLIRLINLAFSRMNDGTYGTCYNCEEDISPARLDAVPWTPYCLLCQQAYDSGRLEDPQEVVEQD